MQDTIPRLIELQRQLRDAVCTTMRSQASHSLSRSVRDDTGDTIFALDIAAEDVLVPFCEEWGKEQPFILIAEGLESDRIFGQPGVSGPEFRLIVDPIDGTRGLMYDKRSAWCLAGTAP
ncbi:MAG: inositol monophosphatase, partial [Planctomycetota bacterium]|nr:inositol monophosphatase [Planctomycetota bacterium]